MDTKLRQRHAGLARWIVLLLAYATLATLLVLLGAGNAAIRAMFVLPLALVGPGFALYAVALPRRRWDAVEVGALSLGMSLVILVLGGLLLNLTPWGISTGSESIFVWGVTLVAGSVTLEREWEQERWATPSLVRLHALAQHPLQAVRDAISHARQLSRATPLTWRHQLARGRQDLLRRLSAWGASLDGKLVVQRPRRAARGPQWLYGLALLLVLAAGIVAVYGARQQATIGVTQFWALPSTNRAHPDQISVGIQNVGNTGETPTTYRVVASVGDTYIGLPSIVLGAGQSWQSVVTVPHWASGSQPLYIFLYRSDETSGPYRQLELWPSGSATATATPTHP